MRAGLCNFGFDVEFIRPFAFAGRGPLRNRLNSRGSVVIDFPPHVCALAHQDVDWFLWVPVVTGKDTVEHQPVEDLCFKCGTALKSYPLVAKQELIDRCRTCRQTRAEIMILGEVASGSRQKAFRPSIVHIRRSVGLRFSSKVRSATTESFVGRGRVGI